MANVDRLLGLFDDTDVSWDAARAIGRIPGPDKVLTKRNHAVLRVNVLHGTYCYSVPDVMHIDIICAKVL